MEHALNPQSLDHIADIAWAWAVAFLPRAITAGIILIFGGLLARWMSRAVNDLVRRTTHIDPTLWPVLAALTRYTILVLVLIVALSQVGIQTGSLLTIVGAAGLAVGLALQSALGNLAAGIMLLWLRPFRTGDLIEVDGLAGSIREIGLFASQLRTVDGIFLFAPNAQIWSKPLKNYTRDAGRLVSIDVTVSGDAEINRVRDILVRMARSDDRVFTTPQPRVAVENLTDAGLRLNLRVWVSRENLGELQWVIVERAMQELEAAGIEALRPRQVVRVIPTDSDPSRLPV